MSLFVALEGIDACGKNVQSRLLADRMGAELFSFPDYATPYGDLIASHLEGGWCVASTPGPEGSADRTDAMVFQSAQFTNRLELQVPLGQCLTENRNVVADRYLASGLAYGAADGLDWKYLLQVQRHLIQPDINILLDIDVEDSVKRRPERRDRYEKNSSFINRVSKFYRSIWEHMSALVNYLGRDTMWVVVNGRDDIDTVHKNILLVVRNAHEIRSRSTWGPSPLAHCNRCNQLFKILKGMSGSHEKGEGDANVTDSSSSSRARGKPKE